MNLKYVNHKHSTPSCKVKSKVSGGISFFAIKALHSDIAGSTRNLHDCEKDTCTVNYIFIFKDGKYMKCIKGSSFAHCWECTTGCDALFV